ncbi:MAG: hypothetical protein WB919_01690 [Candidatus Sulfotelmatobacter sp.]
MSDAKKHEAQQLKDDLDEILRRVDSLPVIDSRSEDEIIGYNQYGLPK